MEGVGHHYHHYQTLNKTISQTRKSFYLGEVERKVAMGVNPSKEVELGPFPRTSIH